MATITLSSGWNDVDILLTYATASLTSSSGSGSSIDAVYLTTGGTVTSTWTGSLLVTDFGGGTFASGEVTGMEAVLDGTFSDTTLITYTGLDVEALNIITTHGVSAQNDSNLRSGDDTVMGASGDEFFLANDGADIVTAAAGDDTIYGNAGTDTIYGNAGSDDLFGGQGADKLFGGRGADTLFGNFAADFVYGNLAADSLHGGQGDDTMFGGQGNDTINGGADDDELHGNLGDDQFRFNVNQGDDTITDFVIGVDEIALPTGTGFTISSSAFNSVVSISGGGTITVELEPHISSSDIVFF